MEYCDTVYDPSSKTLSASPVNLYKLAVTATLLDPLVNKRKIIICYSGIQDHTTTHDLSSTLLKILTIDLVDLAIG